MQDLLCGGKPGRVVLVRDAAATRLLVADDDGHIREVLRYALSEAGHEVVLAADGQEAGKQEGSTRNHQPARLHASTMAS